MRDPKRIDGVLKVLRENWELVPDWRLCQLFCNLQRAHGKDLFFVEDDKFIDLINEYFGKTARGV